MPLVFFQNKANQAASLMTTRRVPYGTRVYCVRCFPKHLHKGLAHRTDSVVLTFWGRVAGYADHKSILIKGEPESGERPIFKLKSQSLFDLFGRKPGGEESRS